jgi:hypothetical protein
LQEVAHESILFTEGILPRLNMRDLSPVGKERLRLLKLPDPLRQKGASSFEVAELLGIPRSTI